MHQAATNQNPKKRLVIDLSLILFFSFLMTLPIFFNGIPGGSDMPQHFQFAKNYHDSVGDGILYPSWAADPNGGNGNVGIRFYPPLTHYVFVLFKGLTGNWFDGFCLSIILFFFAGGAGVYFLAREWFGEPASLFGAITFIVLPYHVNQIYGASMYGEFAAAAIAPFCFLFTCKVARRGRLLDILGLSVAYGLLILTHLPLTVICSIALGFFFVFSLKGVKIIPAVLRAAAAVFASLLLTAFYWSRMIFELNFVNHTSETYSTGYFSFEGHFLLSKYLAFTGAIIQKTSEYNDKMFLVSLAVLLAGATVYFIKTLKNKDFQLSGVAAMTALALFMATPLSIAVWQHASVLQKTQFPWRWLTLIELSAAIFAAAAFDPLRAYLKTSKRFLAFIFIGIWMINAAFIVTDVMDTFITYPRDYFNSLIDKWKTMPSNECWWTVWTKQADKRILSVSERLPEKVWIENRASVIEKWTATERIFTIDEGAPGTVAVQTFYYPHWKAAINDAPVDISPTGSGLISFSAPAEKVRIRLYFEEPFFVVAAFYVSGFMWIIILAGLIFNLRRSPSQPQE